MPILEQIKTKLKNYNIKGHIQLASQANTVTDSHKTVTGHAKIGDVKYLWHLPTHGSILGEKLTGQPSSQQLTFGDWLIQQFHLDQYKSLCDAAQISSDTTHAMMDSVECRISSLFEVDTQYIAPINSVTVEDGWKLHSGLHCYRGPWSGNLEWQGIAILNPPQGYTGSVRNHIFNEREEHTIISVMKQREKAIFDGNMWDQSVKLYNKMQEMTVAAQEIWDEFDQKTQVT